MNKTTKGTAMPRWTKDEDGRDLAGFTLRVRLDRAQFAIMKSFARDNPGKTFYEALDAAFFLGVEQLGLTYDPRRRKI
jgi:hypothetical protein